MGLRIVDLDALVGPVGVGGVCLADVDEEELGAVAVLLEQLLNSARLFTERGSSVGAEHEDDRLLGGEQRGEADLRLAVRGREFE